MAKTTEMILDANLTGNLGDTVTVGGKNYIIGETAFANLKEIVTAAASIPDNVVITVKGGTYADDIDFTTPLDKNAGISFVAAKDETVIFSGKTTLGYRDQGVGAKMWNGPISFTGITFDQAKNGEHSIDVQDVNGLVLRNCTIIGDGEYGIGSSRGNATAPSSIIGCTFENASIQVTGNFGTGLVIDGCTFDESRVNVQSGNSVTIQNSTFSRTLTDAAVGDSFYLIRSNSNPITIKNCVANVDSTVTTGGVQEEWALLWARNANGPKWNVDGLEVNMTDAAMAQGSLDVIKNGKTPAQNTPDRINVSGLTSNQEIADIIAKTDGSVNIFTEGGYASYKDGKAEKTFSFTTVYVNSTFAGAFGEEIETGKFFGVNAFADINAAEIAAEASAVKMVIEAGSDVTYTKDQYYFLNTNESLNADSEGNKINALDEVVGAADSYDMEVNGTLRAYQVLLNNAVTTVSESGRLLATGENFRVMGGTITVQGTREANAAAPAEVFTGSWGGGTKAGADTQIQGGYIDINQGAVATFADTVIFVHAGFFNVNASTAAFDNTYIYLGSGGSYADIQMNITNGAVVTFANNTTVLNDATFGMHITVGEGSTLNLNNATLALDNSKKTTRLTNNGTVTVSGESTVVIDSLTGNGIILNNATLTAASNIANSPATKIYGTSTIKGTVGTVHANFTDTKVNDKRIGYTTEAVALTLDGATTGNVYVGSDTEGYAATLTVKGGSKTGQIYSRVYGTTTITGSDNTIKYINAKGSVNIVDAAGTTITEGIVAEAGNIAITNSTVSLGIGGSYVTQLDKGTTMTVTGSNIDVQQMTIDATSALVLNNSTINVDDVYNDGDIITNNGSITISGESTVKLDKIDGSGWIYMAGATIDEETCFKGANVRFASGENIVDGSVIKDGRFQVGTGLWGVEDPKVSKDGVTVTVKNNAFIGGFDGSASPFGGWVGSQGYDGKVVAADAPRYTLNVQNSNANFGYMHVSHDGVMTITGNAAEMQKYTGVEHSYYSGYLNINGVVTFDAANALVLFTNVSVDNGSTENPGKLIIQNGANYVSYRDSSTKDVSFTISQSGIVEVNNATLDLRHGTLIKENASLSITNNGIFKGNAVTNNGTFSFDQTAKITVGSIVNTGTINVTVTGEAATNYFGGLVIDANAASDYGQVNVSVEGKNFEAVVNGNDLYVVDTTIYVNSDWEGLADGTDLGGGKYFGVNAFASLTDITPGLTEGARQVQFTYNGTAPGLEITVTNDAAGSSLIYGFGGQTYASLGGANVHEFAPETGKTYIFDFKQGNYSFAVNEIAANKDTTVTPETGSNSASGTVDVAVNEFSGRKDIGFTVATGMEGAMELDIDGLKGAAWVVLYDADGKTVKEYVVIRDGKVTFKDLAAGSYEVAISPAGVPAEVECDVTYNFTQEAVVVTDDTWNNATLFGVDTTAGTTVTDEFTATDVIDWFKFTAADGVNAINFTAEGDFSVIAYTKNASGKLDQCAAFWVFDNGKTGDVDYTRYLNVAAGSEVYLRIEGYGKDVDYSVALA